MRSYIFCQNCNININSGDMTEFDRINFTQHKCNYDIDLVIIVFSGYHGNTFPFN